MAAPDSTLIFSPEFQQLLDRLLDREIERVSQIVARVNDQPGLIASAESEGR